MESLRSFEFFRSCYHRADGREHRAKVTGEWTTPRVVEQQRRGKKLRIFPLISLMDVHGFFLFCIILHISYVFCNSQKCHFRWRWITSSPWCWFLLFIRCKKGKDERLELDRAWFSSGTMGTANGNGWEEKKRFRTSENIYRNATKFHFTFSQCLSMILCTKSLNCLKVILLFFVSLSKCLFCFKLPQNFYYFPPNLCDICEFLHFVSRRRRSCPELLQWQRFESAQFSNLVKLSSFSIIKQFEIFINIIKHLKSQ